tara:strand:+ start:194 stop:811 length:618 start_codon:yes stop_codon:yes gene_type:complete
MKFEIISSPNSYLKVDFEKNEKIIIEKGCFISSTGEYEFENKVEAKSVKNILAKFLSDKSLVYNIFKAKENLEMLFSAKDTAEIFSLEVSNNKPIMLVASLHFARTDGIKIIPGGFKNDFYVKTEGNGILFLKAYGKIIEKNINSDKPIYVDEDAVIAFEEKLNYESITGGMKKLLTSGEGFLCKFSGKGKLWIQTKDEIEYKKG